MVLVALLCMVVFNAVIFKEAETSNLRLLAFLPVLAFVPLAVHLRTVYKNNSAVLLDPELKKVALSTFFMALLCVLSVGVLG
jgi:1,4-dihydroxy-2-naphthoate octaprenyltransferase